MLIKETKANTHQRSSSVATVGHPAPAVLAHGIHIDPKFFGGRLGEMEDGLGNKPA